MNKKKLLALLMALVMTLTLVPVTALATEVNVAEVDGTPYTTLQAAINDAQPGATVTLLADVTGSFTINKSLTLTAAENAKITGSGTSAIAITAPDVTVNLNNLTIAKGATRGVCIDTNASGVILNITGGSIAANSYALDTRPGADDAAVTINGTGLDGWAAMNVWGDNSTFAITGSQLLGANTATQSSSNDFAVIALEADTSARGSGDALAGQYADGNTITLTNCTIGATTTANQQAIIVYNAYGEDNDKPSRPNAATYLDTGKHAKNNTVYFDGCNVNTAGNLIYDGASVLAGQDGTTISAAYNNKFIVKTSGTYTSDPSAFVADGYKAVNNGNGTWTVGVDPDTAVAKIGETYFTTLDAALEAANNGDTIVLLKNIVYNTTSNLNITKSVTIDGQGTYSVSGGMEGGTAGTGSKQQYGPIVIWPNETVDSVTLQNLTIVKTGGNSAFLTAGARNTYLTDVSVTAQSATGIYSADGITTLVNCNVTNTGENSGASFRNSALQASGGSELVIKSGNYQSDDMVMNTLTSGGLITVEGGTFSGKIYVYNTTDNYWNTYGQGVVTIKGGTFNNVSFELAGGTHPGKIVITGGLFDADPSAYVADGYEAVLLTSGANEGKWQVGKVKATELHETNSTEATKTFTASKNVVDKNDTIIPSDSNTTFTVTVIEGTKDPYGTTDTVSLNNVKMEEVVALAVDKANESNTNNAAEVSAYVTVQLAKGSATVESTKATFEVHPEAVITVGEIETKVPLTNDQIKGSFSFALDVDDVFPNSTDFVVVHVHEDGTKENLGVFTKDSHGEITLSNIKQFSDFEVSPLVLSNDDSGNLYFEGGSLRRRVKTINGQLTDEVIRGFTDFRFGYQIMDYNASNQEVSYYFQWSKDGVNWSKAISATNIDAQGHVSLVITSVPQSWYGNNLYSRLYKVDADGNVTMSATNGRTVNQVADYYIDYHTQFELRWVNYAKLLRGGNGVDSYYVVRDAQNNTIIGHKLNSSDEMISDGTMSQ